VGKAPWFPNMAWRPNNKLVFDGNGLFEYDPVTRVKKTVNEDKLGKNILYHAFRINQRTGNIYITGVDTRAKGDGGMVASLNPDWSLKKEYFLSAGKNLFFISPDGKKMISHSIEGKYGFNFTRGQKIEDFKPKGFWDFPFTPDSKNYFSNSKWYLSINDLKNNKEDKLCYIPFGFYKLSLINCRGKK
ncbi:MAG: hypothetical protein GY710_12955, partial [Desulfobacteraceae bacterium]|nr:hypothetical protein [Desulfobacteraceae bacterium]